MSFLIKSALTLASIAGARRVTQVVRGLDVNDALGVFGLARRSSALDRTLPIVGMVALGAVIGAGTALLLAPSSGPELRTRLSGRVGEAKELLEDAAERSLSKAGIGHPSSQTSHS